MLTLPVTAAQCGRFFVAGLSLFWLLLLLLWSVPAEQYWLLQTVKWLWLCCFILTLSSYLLILLQRIGILILREPEDE